MANGDDEMNEDLSSGTQTDVDQQPPAAKQSLKGVGSKKGPKLARGRGKPSVTISNKTSAKADKPKGMSK